MPQVLKCHVMVITQNKSDNNFDMTQPSLHIYISNPSLISIHLKIFSY